MPRKHPTLEYRGLEHMSTQHLTPSPGPPDSFWTPRIRPGQWRDLSREDTGWAPGFLVLPRPGQEPHAQTGNKARKDPGPLTWAQTPSAAASPPAALMFLFLPPLRAPEPDPLFAPTPAPPRAAESFINGEEKNHDSAMVTLEPD